MSSPLDFERIFNLAPNPYMLLDRDLRFVAANEAYLKVTGSRRDDLLGRTVFEAFPGNPEDPDDPNVQLLRASFERVLRRRVPDTLALIPYTMPRQTAAGPVYEERFWSATNTPILDERGEVTYILQHTVDVTELQRMKQALREAEAARAAGVVWDQMEEGVLRRARTVQAENRALEVERQRMRRLFEQAPGFIAIVEGPEHVFVLVNATYRQLIGHRDVIGRPVAEALPEVVEQGFVDLLDQVYATGEPFIGKGVTVQLQRAPGGALEEVVVDFIYQPVVEADGTVSGIFAQGYEVTQEVRIRAELERLNASLEQRVAERTAELQERNRELQEFAYVVTHDLQEPLRKIHTFTDLVVMEYGDVVDEEGRMYFDRIRAGVTRMSMLIQDLLAYARLATLEKVFQPVDLNDVAQEVLGDLQIRIQETGGAVFVGSLPTIDADPVQMRQLLQNLIGNALKFHRPDVPPRVRIDGQLENLGEDHAARLHLSIQDNGIGFPQQYAERIFAPFQRLHSRNQYEGTGIGLATCRRIVERHGGSIGVESVPDEGTTFFVDLPVHHAATEEKAA